MRSVRCDVCGTKALMAASKCPKCSHVIEVRDGFGEMLPLALCGSCNSYYPERLGACKWCGPTTQRSPIGPHVWKGIGVAAFVAMAWGAWLVHDDPPADASKARLQAMLKPDSSESSTDSTKPRTTLASNGRLDSLPPSSMTGVDLADTTIQSVAATVVPTDSTIQAAASTGVVALDAALVLAATEPAPEPEPVDSSAVAPPARVQETPSEVAPTHEPTRVEEPAPRVVPRASAPPPARVAARTPVRTAEKPAARTPVRAKPAPARASASNTDKSPPEPKRALARSTTRTPARVVATKPPPKATPAPAPKSVNKTVVRAPEPQPKAVVRAPAPASTRTRGWVNSVARGWVIVRAGASRDARILASVGPNTRVQLGESRDGWRRIRTKGLAGWVEHERLFARLGPTPGRLAARE